MYLSLALKKVLAVRLFTILIFAILTFGSIYWVLGNFIGQGLKSSESEPSFLECIYFSVITMTTLGYGDIVPLGWSRLFASIEAIFGLTFIGYAISQIVSVKQEALVEYLANDRIIQTYDECLKTIEDAKELIGDRRRMIQNNVPVNLIDFIYNRSNPFYPALRAIDALNGYTAHIEGIGNADVLTIRIERAAHHVEELASFTRKYINLLNSKNINWRTDRTKQIVTQLCDAVDSFTAKYIVHTRYATQSYKDGGLYTKIVSNLTRQIRRKLRVP